MVWYDIKSIYICICIDTYTDLPTDAVYMCACINIYTDMYIDAQVHVSIVSARYEQEIPEVCERPQTTWQGFFYCVCCTASNQSPCRHHRLVVAL